MEIIVCINSTRASGKVKEYILSSFRWSYKTKSFFTKAFNNFNSTLHNKKEKSITRNQKDSLLELYGEEGKKQKEMNCLLSFFFKCKNLCYEDNNDSNKKKKKNFSYSIEKNCRYSKEKRECINKRPYSSCIKTYLHESIVKMMNFISFQGIFSIIDSKCYYVYCINKIDSKDT